ncbi:ABC transporter ATP-binding protein [Lysinibacillus odysseyi]|uniref:ABC transporter ATP-binding protein n=1 Tax=Lysinibacillus odysseyi 34hs-1 = NBRC 100172 TaxID=1220589 RepID=A0A0A3J008_9BACI|nr:ABC transporter ATP-binding protein [Lysinibacillus odysseyi]KGR88508.1 ABC transporter ATP-binding protein [Lysinibacillus odysseyi 34hs-1 = NBRC 100172]
MIIDVQGLKKRYKEQEVLKNITFQIDEPKIVALVGPNGSGKTTMMNCLMNLLPFQEGEVTILGKNHKDPTLFYEVSYLQDNRVLYGDLTGEDHLKFICNVQKLPVKKAKETAEAIGMAHYVKKRVRSYSLGMKQHLLLAMAVLNNPKLVLLDEPINGLDPTSAIHMRNILMDLYTKGTTVIISSHNLDEIDKMTNTIYFMKDGEILEESLADLNIPHYSLTVSDTAKAMEHFTLAGLPVGLEHGDLTFSETSYPLQTAIDICNQNGIQIHQIENRKIGAEKRYMELFESELKP